MNYFFLSSTFIRVYRSIHKDAYRDAKKRSFALCKCSLCANVAYINEKYVIQFFESVFLAFYFRFSIISLQISLVQHACGNQYVWCWFRATEMWICYSQEKRASPFKNNTASENKRILFILFYIDFIGSKLNVRRSSFPSCAVMHWIVYAPFVFYVDMLRYVAQTRRLKSHKALTVMQNGF